MLLFEPMNLMFSQFLVSGTIDRVVHPEPPETVVRLVQYVAERETLQPLKGRVRRVGFGQRHLVGRLEGLHDELFLVLEMIINRPGADLRPGRDLSHAGGIDAELGNDLVHGRQELGLPCNPARARLPFLRRLSHNAPSAAPGDDSMPAE